MRDCEDEKVFRELVLLDTMNSSLTGMPISATAGNKEEVSEDREGGKRSVTGGQRDKEGSIHTGI